MKAKLSAGLKRFAVFFIIYSCLMFLGRVTCIIFQLVEQNGVTLGNIYPEGFSISDIALYSSYDAAVDFLGLGLAFFVFLAGLRILMRSKLAYKNIRLICTMGILYNILAIAKDSFKILNNMNLVEWSALAIAVGIAACLLSIAFWIFVYFFFSQSSVKKQLGISRR